MMIDEIDERGVFLVPSRAENTNWLVKLDVETFEGGLKNLFFVLHFLKAGDVELQITAHGAIDKEFTRGDTCARIAFADL